MDLRPLAMRGALILATTLCFFACTGTSNPTADVKFANGLSDLNGAGGDGGGVAGDTAAGDAGAGDAANTADAKACAIGAVRCGGVTREICAAAGWVADPCPASSTVCVNGSCRLCLPGETFCAAPATGTDTSVQVLKCNATGDSADLVSTCAAGSTCTDGGCAKCAPGAHRCTGGARELCQPGGQGWVAAPCPSNKAACFDGQCLVCTPGKKFCAPPEAGETVSMLAVLCDKQGIDFELAQSCAAPQTCDNGACVSCPPNASKCAGANQRSACTADGQQWITAACPAASPFCIDGECLLCPPGKSFCGPPQANGAPATNVLQCNALGDAGSLAELCAPGLLCVDGACGACAAGGKSCLGNSVLVCAEDGAGFAQGEDCGSKNLSCAAGACGCAPGETQCSAMPAGLALAFSTIGCDAQGTTATPPAACKAGESCQNSLCSVCQPADKSCQDGKAVACKNDGSGWQISQDCVAAGLGCVASACQDLCDPLLLNPTHQGCDFWAVDLDNAKLPDGGQDAQNAPFAVLISNHFAKPAKVTVTFGSGATAKTTSLVVAANSGATLQLPVASWGIPAANQDGTQVDVPAYHLTSDHPVSVVQHNPYQAASAFSADASLLLPANALGTSYRIVSRKQSLALFRTFLTVVATRPGKTSVSIGVTAATLAGGPLAALGPGASVTVVLETGQVLNLETDGIGADLTGSLVIADQPVAVFAGAEAAHSPDTTLCVLGKDAKAGAAGACNGTGKICFGDDDCAVACCADHLEEQLLPVAAWGTTHIATHLQLRAVGSKEQDAWRIVAALDGTVVITVPVQAEIPLLAKGQYFEFQSTADFVILANQPIAVAQFMASSKLTQVDAGDQGDPAMLLALPVTRHEARHGFLVPSGYANNFINIAGPPGAIIKVDGVAVTLPDAIAGQGWRVLRKAVGAGFHTVVADRPVDVKLYGWQTGVSYAHPAGMGAP
jgi:hypothetical protein